MAARARRTLALAAAGSAGALLLAGLGAVPATAHDGRDRHDRHEKSRTVDLQILSFNDYHGHLAAAVGCRRHACPGVTGASFGGVRVPRHRAADAAHGEEEHPHRRRGRPHRRRARSSPACSRTSPASSRSTPSASTSSSVGNHEFDEGVPELLRMQYGGCSPTDGLLRRRRLLRRGLPLARRERDLQEGRQGHAPRARPRTTAPGSSAAPGAPSCRRPGSREVEGVKVGFIGMTLEATPELVAQAGHQGRRLPRRGRRPPVSRRRTCAGAASRRSSCWSTRAACRRAGRRTTSRATPRAARRPSPGPIVDIAKNLDPRIDMVVSGHTHQPYTCSIPDPAGNPR